MPKFTPQISGGLSPSIISVPQTLYTHDRAEALAAEYNALGDDWQAQVVIVNELRARVVLVDADGFELGDLPA